MKQLILKTEVHKSLLQGFETYLSTINYSDSTRYNSKLLVHEFLHFIESQSLDLKTLSSVDVESYFQYLNTRHHRYETVALSNSYVLKHRASLVQFFSFMQLTGVHSYSNITFPQLAKEKSAPTVLTTEEVRALFTACDNSIFGKRNKALLALCYGCGLRRSEATNLNRDEIDFQRSEVFVSRSKNSHQRIVPISENTQKVLVDYAFNTRELLLWSKSKEPAFLISQRGTRLSDVMANLIVRNLTEQTKIAVLIQKKPTLHSLRHSIATHLLAGGMSLENIALFLGHKSLDSTQIYTHLANH
jgi:integrase/recombinase XerD